MKTFEEHLNEILQVDYENPNVNIFKLRGRSYVSIEMHIIEASKRYAKGVAEDALNRAAENARTETNPKYGWLLQVDKESILETEIILT